MGRGRNASAASAPAAEGYKPSQRIKHCIIISNARMCWICRVCWLESLGGLLGCRGNTVPTCQQPESWRGMGPDKHMTMLNVSVPFCSVLFCSGLVWCSPRIGCVPMVVAHSLIIKPRWKVENGGGPAHTASDGTTGATTTIHIMITMWVGQRNSNSSSSKISRSSSPTLREISAWPRYVKPS